MEDKKDILKKPTALPESADAALKWQTENRSWWEKNAMRYDWGSGVDYPEFSREFFAEIDKRFFSKVFEFFPWTIKPFDRLIDFKNLGGKRVLEIGVGTGSVAQLLAEGCPDFTGIDITEYAITATKRRFGNLGLTGNILRMDAEKLDFPDNSFDFIWSWGVVHHSANTAKVISEIVRVLKPGGRVVFMVYHRGWWNYYVVGPLVFGLLKGGFFRYGSLHKVMQAHTDGATARYYTTRDWPKQFPANVELEEIFVCGPKSDILPVPGGKTKNFAISVLPDSVSRFFTNKLSCGSFLVSVFRKKGN
jgi:ubiquinone/menaquinone biosynthesis C-methylase UbiE